MFCSSSELTTGKGVYNLLTIYQIMIISPYHQVVPAALADLPPRPAPHPLRRLRGLLQRGGQAAEAAGCGARHGILLLHLLLVQGWTLASANCCYPVL